MSTVDDYLAFARMLLAGGTAERRAAALRAGVARGDDHRPPHRPSSWPPRHPIPSGGAGWGYGVSVRVQPDAGGPVGRAPTAGTAGSAARGPTIPPTDLIGILLTNQMWTSPEPPAVCSAFWSGAYAARA